MKRLTDYSYCRTIEYALRTLPRWLRPTFKDVHYFCGADATFAGIEPDHGVDNYGRLYKRTAHIQYGEYLPDGITTVFLPQHEEPYVVVHELGHVLHEMLHFGVPRPQHAVGDVRHASLNDHERFACWFSEWAYSHQNGLITDGDEFRRLVLADERMMALMAGLQKQAREVR